jgi:hypothetical protein
MRRVLASLAFCFAAFAPLSATAQETEPTASVGSLALELIAEGGAADVFEPLPSEQLIVVRHGRSGLVCRLEPDNRNRLVIFPQAARGEDVACDTTDGAESSTLYATRFSFEATLEDLIGGAVTAIHQRFPDARQLPPLTENSAPGLPASQSAHFMVTRPDGALLYTRVTVAIVGQWAIKLRYSVVAPDEAATQRGQAAAAMLWNATLSDLTQQRL